jgi:hypothetical protein
VANYWTEKDDALLLSLIADSDGITWGEVAEEVGKSSEACRKRYSRIREIQDDTEEENTPVIQSIVYRAQDSAGWRDRVHLAMQVQTVREGDNPFTNIADMTIKSDMPIAVLFTSDWQFGSLCVDYPAWLAHIEEFLACPNAYMMVNGDLVCNTYLHSTLSAVWSQVMSPEEQMRTISGLADELIAKNKLLAMTLSEEHDQKDERATGMSSFTQFLRDKKVPLFNNRGTLLLRLGSFVYVIYCVHASRFKSSTNILHSASKEFQLGMPANVVVTSHTHQPAISQYTWYTELSTLMEYMSLPIRLGGTVYSVQTGTYETSSSYSERFFSQGGKPKLQILMFWPNEFRIEPVDSLETVKKVLSETVKSKKT